MPVKYEKNAVVITPAPKLNYLHNYVQLPYDYGRDSYEKRLDVIAIKQAVRKSLTDLDKETGWKEKFKGQKILLFGFTFMIWQYFYKELCKFLCFT